MRDLSAIEDLLTVAKEIAKETAPTCVPMVIYSTDFCSMKDKLTTMRLLRLWIWNRMTL